MDAFRECAEHGRIGGRIDSQGCTVLVLEPNDRFFAGLTLLGKNQLVKTLRELTMVSPSNHRVSFHSGGEIPVPVPEGLGAVGIKWEKYGTLVDVLPIMLPNRTLRLQCRARLSEIDSSLSFSISGATVPAVRDQEIETEGEVPRGKTLVLAGLVKTVVEYENVEPPASAPKSARHPEALESRNELETVVLITPELPGTHEPPR